MSPTKYTYEQHERRDFSHARYRVYERTNAGHTIADCNHVADVELIVRSLNAAAIAKGVCGKNSMNCPKAKTVVEALGEKAA